MFKYKEVIEISMEAKIVGINQEELITLMERLENIRDEMDSIIEELEIILDREMMESIKRGEEDIERGEVYTLEEFRYMVKE